MSVRPSSGAGPVHRAVAAVRRGWARLRAWRRLRFTRAGAFFTVGALAVGFAAINTGNNLLYLLMGAMLGVMAVSGWLSEQTIRSVRVRRSVPRGTPVGADVRIRYHLHNRKSRLSSWALEVYEAGLAGRALVGRIGPDGRTGAEARVSFSRRGVYPLGAVTIGTDFPFGLFRKERDVEIPGELIIWPRTDRPVRPWAPGAGRRQRREAATATRASGLRGEYRGLREYRAGDDPRDIHWRSSARTSGLVVREYDQDASDTLWIALDVASDPGPAAEAAVEIAASLAARALTSGSPVGLAAGDHQVAAGRGTGHLERILEALARADFGSPAGARPPVSPEHCVLVTATSARGGGWADVHLASAPTDEGDDDGGPGAGSRLRGFLRGFLGWEREAAA